MEATAPQSTSEISEFLSWEEICARYPNEWVVLVDTVHHGRVVGARVYGHHPDRQAHRPMLRAAISEQRSPMSRWTGEAREPRWRWMRVLLPD